MGWDVKGYILIYLYFYKPFASALNPNFVQRQNFGIDILCRSSFLLNRCWILDGEEFRGGGSVLVSGLVTLDNWGSVSVLALHPTLYQTDFSVCCHPILRPICSRLKSQGEYSGQGLVACCLTGFRGFDVDKNVGNWMGLVVFVGWCN